MLAGNGTAPGDTSKKKVMREMKYPNKKFYFGACSTKNVS
jgi:hypothetical protein